MILVFGYQSIGHICLRTLLDLGERELHLITHRDRPGETIWWESAAELARAHGVGVTYGDDLSKQELVERVRDLAPRLIYSFYYRDILPMAALKLAPLGAYNMHGSYLPEYRGRCPVNWAVLHRAARLGVTLHHMTARADAGDIVGQRPLAIGDRDTAFDVFQGMIPLASEVLREAHPRILAGTAPRIPQDESAATTFGGRRPADGAIDWTRSADDIDALVRAVTRPYPGAFADLGGERLLVWECAPASGSGEPGEVLGVHGDALRIACGEGALDLLQVSIADGPDVTGASLEARIPGGCVASGSVA